MSGSSVSIAVAGGEVGGYGYRPPFTAVQWQELEHQAMIYKYLVAGLPVPPDLVMPIRRSFEALSARFFHHPSLGYCSYYGKKFDPEPGRCRRTDGKKWRCSKDAYPDSKYCERHMHRGRNRSRKPVESQVTPNTSATLPTTRSGTFQNVSPYSVPSPEAIPFATSIPTKLQMDPVSFGIDNKDFRFGTELQQPSFFGSEINGPGPGPVKQEQRPMRPFFDEWPTTKESWVFDNEGSISGPGPVKQEQHSMRPFFDEWPMTKESWANLDDEGSNKNAFSTTQLSISIPMDPPEFSSRD